MTLSDAAPAAIRAGNLDGMGPLYQPGGQLLLLSDETIRRAGEGWNMSVRSPWRRLLPNLLFPGYNGKVVSRLFVTSDRIVLLREVNMYQLMRGNLTPYGVTKASEVEARLQRTQATGGFEFCEIWPKRLRIVKERRIDRPDSWMDLRLLDLQNREYAVLVWKWKGSDPETLSAIESSFPR